MYDFKIHGGDLELDHGGDPRKVTGNEKLEQEMTHLLLTSRGDDYHHPKYGSDLDHLIGEVLDQDTTFMIQSNIKQALQMLQKDHAGRVAKARAQGRLKHLKANELLLDVMSITVVQDQDTAYVTVRYTTAASRNGSGSTLTVAI